MSRLNPSAFDARRRIAAAFALFALIALAGCREIRVKSYASGVTRVVGVNQVRIIRDERELAKLGIGDVASVRFNHEFAVVLLMGPHKESGWRQVIESIHAVPGHVQVVAYDHGPLDGGEPTAPYRTYTLWIVPNQVYTLGSSVEVVTPSNQFIASAELR